MNENNEFLNQKTSDAETKKTSQPRKAKVTPVQDQTIPVVEAEEVPPTFDLTIIDKTLSDVNITDEVLAAMKEEFLPLTINGINDKAGYDLVDEKRKFVKKTRVLAYKLCTEGGSKALAEHRAWTKKRGELTAAFEEIENSLEAKIKKIDDEKAEIKAEAQRKLAIRTQERVQKLLSMGMVLQGENYVLGSHLINVMWPEIYDDFTFAGVLAPVEAEAAQIAEKKAANEKAFQELQEKQRLEREQLEKEKREFEEKVRKQKEEQEKLEAEKKLLADTKLKARKSSLFSLGFSQQGETLSFKEVSVKDSDIGVFSDEGWAQYVDDITSKVAAIKDRLEKERLEREKQLQEEAAKKERERIEGELKAKQEAADKAKKEADDKAKADELEKQRVAALLPDNEKLTNWLKSHNDLPLPEFSTDAYKAFASGLQEKLRGCLSEIYKQRPK